MINATALYYKYSKVLYTNSRIMYIGKKKNKIKNPTRNKQGKEKQKLKWRYLPMKRRNFKTVSIT